MPSAGPSQATGRVQPCRAPSRAMPASRASSADTMMSTLTGPEAWRNVPHVVATGNSRPVTRNVMTDRMSDRADGRAARLPRQGEQADERDRQPDDQQDA